MAGPFVRAVSIDYSDDDLDALAETFGRRDIARRDQPTEGSGAIRRAQHQTALRGLVARRAITLGGTAGRPRITFLDPHATLLGAFLQAPTVVTVRHEQGPVLRAVSVFVDDEVAVEQTARPGMAVQRMTAYGRDHAVEVLHREVELPPTPDDVVPETIELTRRMVAGTTEALERGEAPPDCVPARGADVLHARRASGSVTLTARTRDGVRTAERWAWIDAGGLGLWRVHTPEGSPLVTLTTCSAGALRGEIERACGLAFAAGN